VIRTQLLADRHDRRPLRPVLDKERSLHETQRGSGSCPRPAMTPDKCIESACTRYLFRRQT
jgi:hypothetical protein